MNLRTTLSLTVCALAAVTPTQASLADENDAGLVLEEITVTAQRRDQNMQDVPLAITALTAEGLRDQGLKTVDQIASTIPNVQIHNDKGAGVPNWVVRGVALFDYNTNNNPATSIFVDDVYQSSTVMGGGALFDLERVEVLKGPQGGLYGRNTTGGAVQIISKALDTKDGYVSVDYGRWNTYRLEAAQSLPLSDSGALRLAVTDEGSDGWQRSLAGGKDGGAPDRSAGRAQLLLAPSDRFTALVKLFGARDHSRTPLATSNAAYGENDFCAPVLSGQLDNDSCVNFAQINNFIVGNDTALPSSAQSGHGRVVISEPINRLDNKNWGLTLKLDYAADFATLTSISAYEDFRFAQVYDYDATNLRLGNQSEQADIEQYSQELRLLSANDGPLKWLGGVSYAEVKLRDHKVFDIRDNAAVFPPFEALGVADPNDALLDVRYRQKTRYASAYGQLDYAVTDAVNVSGSLRYSWEKSEYRDGGDGFPAAGVVLLEDLNSTYKLDDHLSGKVTIDYHPVDDLMLYASVARGYKSGGIFGGFPQEPADVTPYKEEIVWAYEAGLKSTWLERRLQVNLAAFHYDHSDLQALTTLPSTLTPGQFIFRLTNVGKAKHDGIELETSLRPVQGLTLQASVAYIDAKVTSSDLSLFTFDNQQESWDGRRIDFAPRFSTTLMARYEQEFGDRLMAAAQFDFNHRTKLVDPSTPVDTALRGIDGYGLLNARLSLASLANQWEVALWSHNLLDRHYVADKANDGWGSYYQVDGQPRTYGISLRKSW